jgi:hypothetical protein
MRRTPILLGTVVIIAGLIGSATGAQAATGDLSGRWNSAALRQNQVGYSLTLAAANSPANTYSGVLRMHFQDGTLGKRTKVGVAKKGSKVTMVLPGGSVANGTKVLQGSIGQDGSLFFPNCQTQLAYVTKKTAGTMCLFQQFPA